MSKVSVLNEADPPTVCSRSQSAFQPNHSENHVGGAGLDLAGSSWPAPEKVAAKSDSPAFDDGR
jgi:hypothetical protein